MTFGQKLPRHDFNIMDTARRPRRFGKLTTGVAALPTLTAEPLLCGRGFPAPRTPHHTQQAVTWQQKQQNNKIMVYKIIASRPCSAMIL